MEIEPENKFYLTCLFGVYYPKEINSLVLDALTESQKYIKLAHRKKMNIPDTNEKITIEPAGSMMVLAISSFTESSPGVSETSEITYGFTRDDVESTYETADQVIEFMEALKEYLFEVITTKSTGILAEQINFGWRVRVDYRV